MSVSDPAESTRLGVVNVMNPEQTELVYSVIYDRENAQAWLQSDVTLDVESCR